MKHIVLVMLTIGLFFQANAETKLPPKLYGYWEGNGKGLFIFPGGMRLVEPGGSPTAGLGLEKNVIVVEEVQENGNRVHISFSQDGKVKKSKILIELFFDTQIAVKYQQSKWTRFQKKETTMSSYSSLFDYPNNLDKRLYIPSFEEDEKYEKLVQIPKALTGFWISSSRVHRLVLADRVIDSYGTTMIDEIYQIENRYIITGLREITEERVVFIFGFEENQLLLRSYSIEYLLKYSTYTGDLLAVLTREHKSKYGISNLDDILFDTYYLPGPSKLETDFTSPLRIGRDGMVSIGGTQLALTKISGVMWGGNTTNVDTNAFSIILELENPETKEQQKLQGMLVNGRFWFISNNGESRLIYERFEGLIEHLVFQILSVLASVLLTVLILYRLIILPRKLKQRLTHSQLEGIKSQLNPHFLFNSMASIQSLLNQKKPEEANRYLTELSDLLRYHLDAGAEDMVLLSEELAALQHYLELENLRSPFFFSFEVDTAIDPNIIEIPNQLLQALVENAVKHGLRYADDPKLLIRVQKLAKDLRIYIIDNGPGISATKKMNEKLPTLRKTHKGLALIQEKMGILKKKGLKLKLTIKDRAEDLLEAASGTQVELDVMLDY